MNTIGPKLSGADDTVSPDHRAFSRMDASSLAPGNFSQVHLTPALSPLASDANAEREVNGGRGSATFAGGVRSGGAGPAEPCAGGGIDNTVPVSSLVAGRVQSSHPAAGGQVEATGVNFCTRPAPENREPGHLTPALSPLSDNAEREKAAEPQLRPTTVTDDDIRTATARRSAVEAYRVLLAKGMNRKKAARIVGEPWQTLYRWGKAMDALGFDGLLPANKNSGRKPKHRFTRQQAADVKALVLETNRNATSGSVPEACRAAIKRGLLDEQTIALLRGRLEAGAPVLPPSMYDQVRVSETEVRAYRSPRNAWLELVQSPGSLYLTRDEVTGEEREIHGCEQFTIDDGTINFVCCVPFHLPGNKCSENFGVMVGRFQFILPVEHRFHFIPGFNYTARPRSSYRAEDLTATMHVIFAEHGYPRAMVMEKGISASKLITDTLGMLDVKILRASSPHQKVVEGVFNKLWTKLSLMPGQVGRFMGEEEEVNALIGSCRRGATDPRQHFPMLADVLKAIKEAITEHNAQRINSRQYGSWIPREKFEQTKHHLRKLELEQQWMFAPVIAERMVQGFKARVSVPMIEQGKNVQSEVFDFSAEFMKDYNRALVKLYFNPFAPQCIATVVLAQNFNGVKTGTVLGHAEQINRMTRFRRRAFGYGEDPDIGLDATRRNAQALRRSVVAIRADGSTGAQAHEARNGVGDGETASTLPAAPRPELPSDRAKIRAAGVSEQEFERQAARLAKADRRPQTTLVVSDDE